MRVQLAQLRVLAPRITQDGGRGDLARQQLEQHHAEREHLPARRGTPPFNPRTWGGACNEV